MSCFWDSLCNALNHTHFANLRKNHNISSLSPLKMVNFLKSNNKKTINVYWQNKQLTEKQYQENIDAIKEYNSNNIPNGYMCSTCDPFLLLFAELLQISIEHNYMNNIIIYKYINSEKTIKLKSNNSHIDFIGI